MAKKKKGAKKAAPKKKKGAKKASRGAKKSAKKGGAKKTAKKSAKKAGAKKSAPKKSAPKKTAAKKPAEGSWPNREESTPTTAPQSGSSSFSWSSGAAPAAAGTDEEE